MLYFICQKRDSESESCSVNIQNSSGSVMEVSSAVTNSHLQSAENYILEVWESKDDNDRKGIIDCNLSYYNMHMTDMRKYIDYCSVYLMNLLNFVKH